MPSGAGPFRLRPDRYRGRPVGQHANGVRPRSGVEQRQDERKLEIRRGLISERKRSVPTTAASSGRSTFAATLR